MESGRGHFSGDREVGGGRNGDLSSLNLGIEGGTGDLSSFALREASIPGQAKQLAWGIERCEMGNRSEIEPGRALERQ